MSNFFDAIIQTRKTAADILVKSLTSIEEKSETEIRDKILLEAKNHKEIFETGWYDPPTGGLGILFDQYPFKRLKYDSLRKPEYAPNKKIVFKKESVGMIYSSFVDRKTKMLGDIGFPIYQGQDEKIRQHIKNSYNTILKIAEHAKVGMEFADLCLFSENLFQNKLKPTKWITVNYPVFNINLGHSIPGSFENDFTFGNSFEEIKNTIKTKRIMISKAESFKIPKTCAFTIESRLEDLNDPDLPSIYFHFIVCFDNGKKTILQNFDQIFNAVGMNWMNLK